MHRVLLVIAALGGMSSACSSAPAPETTAPAAAHATEGAEVEAVAEAPKADSLDPVVVSPEVFKVLNESDRMRAIEATWQPGQRDNYHGHPALAVYALTDVFGLAYEEDESQISIRVKQGRGLLQAAVQKHAFENRGREVAKMLIVEFKDGVTPAPMPKKAVDAQRASPDVYELIAFDTNQRVLLGTWAAGQQDAVHGHAAHLMYALTDVTGELTDAEGKVTPVNMKAGQSAFKDPTAAQQFRNTGAAQAQVLFVEARK